MVGNLWQDQFGRFLTNGLPATASITVSLTAGTGPCRITITNIGLAGGKGMAFMYWRWTLPHRQAIDRLLHQRPGRRSQLHLHRQSGGGQRTRDCDPTFASATAGVIFTQQPVIQDPGCLQQFARCLTPSRSPPCAQRRLRNVAGHHGHRGGGRRGHLYRPLASGRHQHHPRLYQWRLESSVTSSVVAVSAATPALVRGRRWPTAAGRWWGTQNITAGNAITVYAITLDSQA